MTGQVSRYHIVGGPGSGKSTLARQITGLTGVPAYDLDAVGFENGAGAERPLDIRLAEITAIAARPAWVTEGIYLGWTEALFIAAETVIWLDLPWRTAGWRIITRHIKAELRGNNPHTGWLKLARFLKWCQQYYTSAVAPDEPLTRTDYAETRLMTQQYLKPYAYKVIHCTRPEQVRHFLTGLS